MRLRASLFVVALGGAAAAQPVPRDHRHPPPPPGVGVGVDIHLGAEPTEAPPPPQAENPEPTRAGFVWVAGSWDWKGYKYEWAPGHWERERAGKHWRDTHWDQRDGKWVRTEGGWDDSAGAPPPPPGNTGIVPPDMREHHRTDWKLARPTVSSYWPAKGKAGTEVVIHGVDFPAGGAVLFIGLLVVAA